MQNFSFNLSKNKPFKSAFFLFVALFLSIQAFSQGTDATITGKILDEKGEAIPGVSVRIKNESTGFQTGAISNVQGEYQFQQLPLGKPYTISISFVGYQTQIFSDYALNQGDRLKINAKLLLATTQLS